MKIVMIYDQIQSGMGTKDDKMLPLGGKKEAIGPAVMMQSCLKEIDGKVIATLYCGNGTYLEDPDLVVKKLTMMVKKLPTSSNSTSNSSNTMVNTALIRRCPGA